MLPKYKYHYLILFYFIFVSLLYSQYSDVQFDINSSKQLIVVVPGSSITPDGTLYRFERNKNSNWELISKPIPIIIGKNGLGKSKGLIQLGNLELNEKVEGDGKSPAGIFALKQAFGFAPEDELDNLKMPYLHIVEGTECIDDPKSKNYNQIVINDKEELKDWESSERMWKADPWYRFGVVIDINNSPISKGKGSCLFLHNWDGPNDSTVGCTAMAPEFMKEIIFWLDIKKRPILVQLTTELYNSCRDELELPSLK